MRAATFSDLPDGGVESIAEALKGTTWLAIFSRVSKACRSAAVCVAEGDDSLRCLKIRDVVSERGTREVGNRPGVPTL